MNKENPCLLRQSGREITSRRGYVCPLLSTWRSGDVASAASRRGGGDGSGLGMLEATGPVLALPPLLTDTDDDAPASRCHVDRSTRPMAPV